MNYKSLYDWSSGFVEWVLRRHPLSANQQNGFMGGFIFGERGLGKSTYSFKVGAKTYYVLNGYTTKSDEEDAYKEALKYIFYDPSEFRSFLIYNKLKRIVSPYVCLDDASMHFGNMLHITNPKIYSALMGETATIRTAVTGFLITAPKRKHVVKFLRDYDDFKGEAKTDSGGGGRDFMTWNRKVRYYRWNYYPDEVRYRIQVPFQDKYSCYIPEPFYTWYLEKKRYYELKHELEVADTIDKSVRYIFIKHKNDIPEPLQRFVDKWIKEMEEQEKDKKMEEKVKRVKDVEFKLKIKKLEERIQKMKDAKEKNEDN
jgi:hypothetical protein